MIHVVNMVAGVSILADAGACFTASLAARSAKGFFLRIKVTHLYGDQWEQTFCEHLSQCPLKRHHKKHYDQPSMQDWCDDLRLPFRGCNETKRFDYSLQVSTAAMH
jgi:hypothetical protein